MANPIIRPIPIYVNNDKVAEATKGTWKINGNVSLEIAADSVGVKRGRPTVACTFNEIVPVKGRRVDAQKLCASQVDITVEILVEGRMQKSDGVIDGSNLEWDYASGACMGDSSFIGGPPEFN